MRINVYINQHLWSYFKEDDKIYLTLFLNGKGIKKEYFFRDGIQFNKYSKFINGYINEHWKMIPLSVDEKIFQNLNSISYLLEINNGIQFINTITFNNKYQNGYFYETENRVICYSQVADMFVEFFFLPENWGINNHHLWPNSFRREVETILLVLNRLLVHKDTKYCVIDALARLYKNDSLKGKINI